MKLPVVSGGDVVKALSKIGFNVVKIKGSHVKLKKGKYYRYSTSS